MKELGVIPEDMDLSKPKKISPHGSRIPKRSVIICICRIDTYSEMIDRVDQQTERIVEKFNKGKIFRNTLVLLLSDNVTCTTSIRTRSRTTT